MVRSWRAAVCRRSILGATVTGALLIFGGPVVAESFHERCAMQNRKVVAQMQWSIDVDMLCRCQARRLREQGYEPDRFYDDLSKNFERIGESHAANTGNGQPDPKVSDSVNRVFSRAMQDASEAFRACIARDVEREVMQGLRQGIGRGT